MQYVYTAIGKKIRQKRKELKWTQEILADKVNTTPQYISRIERGKVCVSLDFLYKFAEAFDCPSMPCCLPPRQNSAAFSLKKSNIS